MRLSALQDTLSGLASTVSSKGGVYTARRSFFYTSGYTAEKMARAIQEKIPSAIVLDSGEVWKDFRGGAPVAKQSHWWVRFKMPPEA